MCEEYESLHDRSGQPDVVMRQSIVLSEIKAEVPLENDDTQHIRIFYCNDMKTELSLSQTDRVSKFCMDAGLQGLLRLDSIS